MLPGNQSSSCLHLASSCAMEEHGTQDGLLRLAPLTATDAGMQPWGREHGWDGRTLLAPEAGLQGAVRSSRLERSISHW